MRQVLLVYSISVLTINEGVESELDLVKVVEDAKKYFPTETWEEVRYLGELSLEHDFRIDMNTESLGVFLFERLIKRIGKIRDSDRLENPLLGITRNPIVTLYYFFDGRNFKKALYLVHDYVTERVGVVSLFQVEEDISNKVVAHGLGHNKGLRHHVKPVDLMHPDLLRFPKLRLEGFCKGCLRKLDQMKKSD